MYPPRPSSTLSNEAKQEKEDETMKKTLLIAGLFLILSAPASAGGSNVSFSLGYSGYYDGVTLGVGYHGYSGRAGYGMGYHRSFPRYRRHRVVVHHPTTVRVEYRSTGHWEVREKKIWVAGYYEKTWVPARYQEIFVPGHYDAHGNWIEGHHERRLISQGYYRKEWRPGHYKVERTKVWVTH
jgi:hypothetical protein